MFASVYMTYDKWMASLCLWREARGSNTNALIGIYWVLKNRLASSGFGKSLPEIVLEPKQFTSFSAGDPNSLKFPIPDGSADWTAWRTCQDVVDGFFEIADVDPTNGAVFYESLPERPTTGWWSTLEMTVQIGPFRFYKEKAT
jgi:spore germination cell wall hydrolase CwlJ-like protein